MISRAERAAPSPERAVVLLGASNVTRAIATVLRTAEGIVGEPAHFFVAYGHGRSYGLRSQFFHRELPSIVGCGLWQGLDQARVTHALIADVGNDLIYGASVDAIVGWVRQCLERLAELEARTVCLGLPLASIARLSPERFAFFAKIFFAKTADDLPTIQRKAEALDRELERLAREFGAPFAEQRGEWYGVDPIHIMLAHYGEAWAHILGHWSEPPLKSEPRRGSLGEVVRIRSWFQETRWVMGRERHHAQPVGRLASGSVLSLY